MYIKNTWHTGDVITAKGLNDIENQLATLTSEAEVESARAQAEEARIESLFTTPVQEAVDDWLNRNPQYVTTVQNGTLTQDKFAPDLILSSIKDYITPEMYEAVGDGITDDSLAFQKAINAAVVTAEDGEGNKTIVSIKPIILLSKKYYIKNVQLKSHISIYGSFKSEIITHEGESAFIFVPTTTKATFERCYFYGFSICGSGIGFETKRTAVVEGGEEILPYLSNSVFCNLAFYANLEVGVKANIILCKFDNCIFGYYGTPNSYEHPEQGEKGSSHVIVESSETKHQSTYNLFIGCRFCGATNVSVKLENSLMNYFIYCDIEQNHCPQYTIYGIGCYELVFDKCWIEENTGNTIIYQKAGAYNPACSITFRDCFCMMLPGSSSQYNYLCKCSNGKENFTNCVIYCKYFPINTEGKEFGEFHGNKIYYPPQGITYSEKLPIAKQEVISGGFVSDRWFLNYSGGTPAGWTLSGISIETATGTDSNKYKGTGLHYTTTADQQNSMLYHIKMPGIAGKKLKIVYLANRASGTDDALRPCLSTDGTTLTTISGSSPVTGKTEKIYEQIFNAPSNDFYVGLLTGGVVIEGYIYAFDILYAGNTLIEPVIA